MKKILFLGLALASAATGAPKIASTLGYTDFSIEDGVRTLHDQVQALSDMFQR